MVRVGVLQDGRGRQTVRVVVLIGVDGHEAPVPRCRHERRRGPVDDASAGDGHGGDGGGEAGSQNDGGASGRGRGCPDRELQRLGQEAVSVCTECKSPSASDCHIHSHSVPLLARVQEMKMPNGPVSQQHINTSIHIILYVRREKLCKRGIFPACDHKRETCGVALTGRQFSAMSLSYND